MTQEEWKNLSQNIRDMIIAAFKLAGKDFERDELSTDEAGSSGPSASPWMTRAAAAEYASVSTDTIDNWCAAGLIEKSKLNDSRPGAVLILRASLEKFLRSRVVRKKRIRQDLAPSIKGGYRVNRSKD